MDEHTTNVVRQCIATSRHPSGQPYRLPVRSMFAALNAHHAMTCAQVDEGIVLWHLNGQN